MSICSPGCACTVSLRGTELDPGPVTMGSTGTNHGWGAESRSRELKVTAGSGTGVLMADGAKETLTAVRGRTWHRGGSEWEREARANQGSTVRDCGSSGGGSGRRGWLGSVGAQLGETQGNREAG